MMVSPQELITLRERGGADNRHVYKVEFKEADMFAPKLAGATFELQHYFDHPDQYRSLFDRYTPHLSVLVNGIFWTERCPRLVTKAFLKELYADGQPHLRVIGDISCDIGGSIEATVRATTPDVPCYVYEPADGAVRDGCAGHGPVIMSIDNLPSELPLEASQHFSHSLREFMPEFAAADLSTRAGLASLSEPLRRSVIAFRGDLESRFGHLADCIRKLSS